MPVLTDKERFGILQALDDFKVECLFILTEFFHKPEKQKEFSEFWWRIIACADFPPLVLHDAPFDLIADFLGVGHHCAVNASIRGDRSKLLEYNALSDEFYRWREAKQGPDPRILIRRAGLKVRGAREF